METYIKFLTALFDKFMTNKLSRRHIKLIKMAKVCIFDIQMSFPTHFYDMIMCLSGATMFCFCTNLL